MLHNDGPYGPNEGPENMGALVNIGSMGASPNIPNNLSNLDKMGPQPTQDPSGRYHLPDFTSYNHHNLGLSSQTTSYPSYSPMSFQPTYAPQNTASMHNTGWQSGMLPSHLSPHPFNNQNLLNYPHYGRPTDSQMYTDTSVAKNMCISDQQVAVKPYQRVNELDYDLSNTTPAKYDDFNNINGVTHNKTQEKPLMDSTKRKSLENTVRLIENMLSNTVKNKEMDKNQRQYDLLSEKVSTASQDKVTQESTISQNKFNEKPQETSILRRAITKTQTKINSDSKNHDQSFDNDIEMSLSNNNTKTSSFIETNENSSNNSSLCESEEDNQEKINNNKKKSYKNDKNCSKDDPSASAMETKKDNSKTEQENLMEIEKQVPFIKVEPECDLETEFETRIDVKVEPIFWNDFEDVAAFQRDANGKRLDEIGTANVIDGENTVSVAKEAIKTGIPSSSYYECPNCSLLFNHPKRYLIHYKWHSFGLTNERRSELARERQAWKEQRKEARVSNKKEKKTKDNPDEVKQFECKDCEKVFQSRSSLKNHRHRFHPTRKLECSICKQEVLGSIALKAHEASHSCPGPGPGYRCPECDKTFVYQHSLNKHRDTHLEKTVQCPLCPKMFGTTNQLKMHQKVHERAERGATFRCSYCAKGFYESYNLTVHERTHRGERPFLCEICNTRYGTNSSLKRHIKVSHSQAKPFECPTCHRCFATETIRDRHQIRAHGDPEQLSYACDECDNRYLHQRDLTKHVYKAHKKGKRKKVSDSE